MKHLRGHLPVAVIITLGVALKAALLVYGVVPFNSDEAIVALMARHILRGERPTFFYGQAYMGSLDAWLVAGAFSLLGESVLAIRVVQVLLSVSRMSLDSSTLATLSIPWKSDRPSSFS